MGGGLDLSTSLLGWVAVAGAIVSFGSFAVPIKFPSVRLADPPVHPFVFQTYKSTWVFITCWLVLLWRPLHFTWLGVVSASFWVPSGAAYVVAVDNIGVGITQAIVSSLIIVMSNLWGVFFFKEDIESPGLAAAAFLLLALGISLMAYFSTAPSQGSTPHPNAEVDEETGEQPTNPVAAGRAPLLNKGGSGTARCKVYQKLDSVEYRDGDGKWQTAMIASVDFDEGLVPFYTIRLSDGRERGTIPERLRRRSSSFLSYKGGDSIETDGVKSKSRRIGLAAAVFNGCWGGSVMVPLKIASAGGSTTGGIDFVISFGVGVSIVTAAGWVCLAARTWASGRSLPSLRPKLLLLPGSIAGILWSIGNFSSMYAVLALGEAVGYSACQAAVLVSGLWGLLYFKEAPKGGLQWFIGAVSCTVGIVLLAQVSR